MLLTPEIIKRRIANNRLKKEAEYEKRRTEYIKIRKEKIDDILSSLSSSTSDEDKFILKICELFINRWDCYAIQDNENPLIFPTIYQELTLDIIKESISPDSKITIGIHQINDDKVKWLCYDIDKKHTPYPLSLSDQIIKYLKEWYNLTGYLEPSGSPDSYHVWIFIEPTDVKIAINFHKAFKDKLKSIGIDIRPIDKGISKGDKNLGCMIKLPYNIQRKTNKRSELSSDILTIMPEIVPILKSQKNQKINESKESNNATRCCRVLYGNVTESICCDNKFENILDCESLISKIPWIMKWMKEINPDRSKLDFMIIKALIKIGISKMTIYKYLQTLSSTKTKVHEKGYSYFDLTYSNVIRTLYSYDDQINGINK